MNQRLDIVFGELGISQYLHAFLDQGFDTWDTILDITESDLDALGVKLGHRRKLQRRIANSRGVAPDAALSLTARSSIDEVRPDISNTEQQLGGEQDDASAPPTKRKYRRHPKVDPNAPPRPPSAYVLFSNKMREDLKGRNLSFTEIAKLVGENWQTLSLAEKEPFETQAHAAKEKFSADLAKYKKTPEFRQYVTYLADFKAKHSKPDQDKSEKDTPKRLKLTERSSGGGSSSNVPFRGRKRSNTHSSSEDNYESDSPPTREGRVGSTCSASDFPAPQSATSTCYPLTSDDDYRSPILGHQRDPKPHALSMSPRAPPSKRHAMAGTDWADRARAESNINQRSLPPLADVVDGRNGSSGDDGPYGGPRRYRMSPSVTPGLIGGHSRPPSLHKEFSSAGSTSSSTSFPRTPSEGTLPIHALLSSKGSGSFDSAHGQHVLSEGKAAAPTFSQDRRDLNDLPPPKILSDGSGFYSTPPPLANTASRSPPGPPAHTLQGHERSPMDLDGITALLKAREIVDRRAR